MTIATGNTFTDNMFADIEDSYANLPSSKILWIDFEFSSDLSETHSNPYVIYQGLVLSGVVASTAYGVIEIPVMGSLGGFSKYLLDRVSDGACGLLSVANSIVNRFGISEISDIATPSVKIPAHNGPHWNPDFLASMMQWGLPETGETGSSQDYLYEHFPVPPKSDGTPQRIRCLPEEEINFHSAGDDMGTHHNGDTESEIKAACEKVEEYMNDPKRDCRIGVRDYAPDEEHAVPGHVENIVSAHYTNSSIRSHCNFTTNDGLNQGSTYDDIPANGANNDFEISAYDGSTTNQTARGRDGKPRKLEWDTARIRCCKLEDNPTP